MTNLEVFLSIICVIELLAIGGLFICAVIWLDAIKVRYIRSEVDRDLIDKLMLANAEPAPAQPTESERIAQEQRRLAAMTAMQRQKDVERSMPPEFWSQPPDDLRSYPQNDKPYMPPGLKPYSATGWDPRLGPPNPPRPSSPREIG